MSTKQSTSKGEPEPKTICLHPHPNDDRLDHSLAEHINMETMLAVQLSQAISALRAAKAALSVGPKSIRNHASVQAALAIVEDALP